MPERLVLQPGRIVLRRVAINQAGVPGAVQVLNQWYAPSAQGTTPGTSEGLNDHFGFQSGQYTCNVYDEGTFALVFPNSAGSDGVLHRDRFLCISGGKRIPTVAGTVYAYVGGSYRPGDEWLEVYRTWGAGMPGALLFVGTPTKAVVQSGTVQLSGYDAEWLQKKNREKQAGFWNHSPRDAFEHYTRAWVATVADDFADAPDYTYDNINTLVSANGRWRYSRAEPDSAFPGTVRLRPAANATVAYLQGTGTAPVGTGAPDPYAAWRIEGQLRFKPGGTGARATYGLYDPAARAWVAYTQLDPDDNEILVWSSALTAARQAKANTLTETVPLPGPYYLVIEGREQWVYYYLNGALLDVCPMPASAQAVVPRFEVLTGSAEDETVGWVDSTVARSCVQFLMGRGSTPDHGSYQLPGLPTPGGVVAAYYADDDLAVQAPNDYAALVLGPLRTSDDQIVAQRQEVPIFTTATWAASGIGAKYFSVRWMGAINLDLGGPRDVQLRVTSGAGTLRGLWVGRTRGGEQLCAGTGVQVSPALQPLLGTAAGWYPFLMEWYQQVAANPSINLEYTTTGGITWLPVTSDMLSPFGIYRQVVRNDSHYDAMRAISDSYGYQYTVQPCALESGQFPGQLVPRVRVGRSTEKVVDEDESTAYQLNLDAEQVADVLAADASGLADGKQVAQLTAEVFNYDEVLSHMFAITEYDQLNEITVMPLLQQRLTSLLALRGGVWEEALAQPQGYEELLDSFPLTGTAAKFYWRPGDSVRLALPTISMVDIEPRQILGVQWPFWPDGLGRPQVSFRQRPRNLVALLREVQRRQLVAQRNYQGQLVAVAGSVAAVGGGAGGVDSTSRAGLPTQAGTIAGATLVVQASAATVAWTVQVNGVSIPLTVLGVGRYDITAFVRKAAGTQQLQVALTGGTGAVTYNVELLLAV